MEGKEMVERISSIGAKPTGSESTQKNRATISGAAIGAVAGVYYAYAKKKNILAFLIGGAVVGAITARILMPKS